MTNLIGKYVVLSKVSDDVFNGSHPNGINAGYTFEGIVTSDDPMLVVENGTRGFHTSLVRSIEQDGNIYMVKTMNSTYKVEVV